MVWACVVGSGVDRAWSFCLFGCVLVLFVVCSFLFCFVLFFGGGAVLD